MLCVLGRFSRVRLFAIPWTVARQAPLHGISQVRILDGLPCPLPGHLSIPEIELESPASPALAGKFFTTTPPGKALIMT